MRYRASSPACRPSGLPICAFCGSTQNVEVHHLDSREENTTRENLAWACRPCNTAIGFALRRAGIGRLTRQFNPNAEGARSLGQWITAVLSMKGESDAMDVPAAVAIIQATPPEQRSRFAKQIWRIRRHRGH